MGDENVVLQDLTLMLYQATVRHLRAALEEDERNTLFQIKVLRARQVG